MDSELPPLTLTHSIGRYTLTRLLGRGGMGVVYVARDERLERDVAVKMIAGLSSDDAVKRFWREAFADTARQRQHIAMAIFERGDGRSLLGIARGAAL